ncbi:hypothetical protein MJ646_05385 [Bifidobacterium pseudocatenulatum]|uniref:hypothetical protein n=1 Tax=Bifidobacterium pseudocatenulatum TaxID=28026 RepID=UPI00240D0634|nr:hypothetical protein [Bifidobacterium pseudocatenulatum]WFB80144.1 hypothetical protein MJ646_05385 [Bifidobacterium pseudocatenulatum]
MGEVSSASIGTPLLADIIVHVGKAFLQELENEKGVRTADPMVWMMAAHLDRPECDAGYSGTLLSKDEESEPKRTPRAAKYQCIIMFRGTV